ncbi:hypothetical protein BJ170DRAFT_33759 [Xylariales sp. AK1849]|nr:hypothetical protein BJ170DRAFT_33759 [Xylariales sp. AK1849]
MASTFDFVVVGSGPSGCAVAAGLAKSAKRPKVLLLEAGAENDDRNLRVDGQRWTTFQNQHMNWGYKTAPQEHCANREIDYSRGKGLGGSSAINFGVYSIGARDDYEEWARIVGDDAYRWDRIQARYKALETFHGQLPADIDAKYAAPKSSDHGTSGPLKIGYAAEWETDLPLQLDMFEQAGFPLNPDHNSGNPLGMSILINSSSGGLRSTAKDLLMPQPENLSIITGASVQRVILEGKKAIGVETDGKQYFASKEVILSAGALDTPKILMHSGLGPANQLDEFNIPVIQDIPAIGQGLRDHMFCPLVYARTKTSTARGSFYGDPKAMDAALEQWKIDGTGPWSKFACEMCIGWFKLDEITSSKEFQELPPTEQEYLLSETVPHFEIATHAPVHWLIPNFPKESLSYSCVQVFLYNAQSRGEVTLESSDPNAPLRFNPKYLGSAFDRRAAIEGLRATLRMVNSEAYSKDTVAQIVGPNSESDDDLLEHWKQTISSSWHMTGTVKMGKTDDADAAVDKDFRLIGVEGLRIADMSVVPILASCHIQAVAYVTGVTCAEKLVSQYNLQEASE